MSAWLLLARLLVMALLMGEGFITSKRRRDGIQPSPLVHAVSDGFELTWAWLRPIVFLPLLASVAIATLVFLGALVGLGVGGADGARQGAIAGAAAAAEEYEYGIGEEELERIAESIPKGGGALLLAIEHTWAIPLRNASAASGGVMLSSDFLNPMTLVGLGVLSGEE